MSAKEGKSRKRDRSKLRKRKLLDNENFLEMPNSTADQFCPEGETDLKKMKKDKQEKKRKKNKTSIEKDESHGVEGEKTGNKMSTKRKRKTYRGSEHAVGKYNQCMSNCEDDFVKLNDESKKVRKKSKRACPSSKNGNSLVEKKYVASSDEVYNISSADKDCTKGMKKWIMEYHQSRPGLKILQQKIDDFITAHEAKEEQARREREAQAAEGGWTVVVHHKGRKKTTDSESGMTVGSVAQAAVLDKMGKKKSKEVGLDFYRFQKREAQRNEIMMLQSKFEQDKRRIQQLRAARKFRPY